MCLIVLHWQPGEQLYVSANRDEFYQRQASPLGQWDDYPTLYAGRDLNQGGTWLGINQARHFAALTNVRVMGVEPPNPPSRGELVTQFLTGNQSADEFSQTLLERATDYAPFNLLISDQQQLWYISNYPKANRQEVPAGTHVLSNAQLNIAWPKTELARNQLNHWLNSNKDIEELALLLKHSYPFADEQLPDTGVGLPLERLLSAQFIRSDNYGTRCSTGMILTPKRAELLEVTWDAEGQESVRQNIVI